MLTIRITPPASTAAEKFRLLSRGGIYAGMGKVAGQVEDIVLNALARTAPTRSGAMRGRFYARSSAGGNSVKLQFFNSAPYAGFVIDGTAPHEIVPVNARVLRFAMDGKTVFAMRVSHPGTKPNDYPQRAWASVQPQVMAAIEQNFRGMLGEATR